MTTSDTGPGGTSDGGRTEAAPQSAGAPLATEPQLAGGTRSGWAGMDQTAWVFTLTTFLSALLLFSVQPLFAKMVLPLLGGSPSVWAVAMCFFQGALLAGYCYAHLLNSRVAPATTGFVHLGVMVLAAIVSLPIGLPRWFGEPPPGEPYLWQLGLFSVAVGLPFLAVAANAPLMQAWFARTGHPAGRDPYFMYAASNLGSLIALLGYPLVLEPLFGLSAVSTIWTVGFVALAAAIALCFSYVRSAAPTAATSVADAGEAPVAAPTWGLRAQWIGLALVPSALLTAYTTHIATDVASAPLIWVVPLSIYLLTFVLVFRDRALIPMPLLLFAHLVAVLLALLQMSQTRHDTWFVSAGTGLAAFFLSAMVAHRTLYDVRPAAKYLTEFYLWMSFGGVLGGLFAALVAPKLFTEVYEYPLLLALTMFCRPGAMTMKWRDRDEWLSLWLVVAIGALLLFWLPWAARKAGWYSGDWGITAALTFVLGLGVIALFAWPMRQAVAAMFMVLAITLLPSSVNRGDAMEKARSYFGVYRVTESGDGEFNILTHGTTLHGAQRVRDVQGNEVVDTTPGTYYYPRSPMAKTVDGVRARLDAEGQKGRYGVVGLGTGSLACYFKEGEQWRFFEIDPAIVRIASNPNNFSFISNCQPNLDVVIGDARLTLAKEKDQSFDLIIVDAFSSDAVPVHLLTAEAMRMYASKLTPKGIVLLHISNRYLKLEAVLSATVPLVPELSGLVLSDDSADGSYASTTSTVGIFAKDKSALEPFRNLDEAFDFEPAGMRGWTDDYSDILSPFLAKIR